MYRVQLYTALVQLVQLYTGLDLEQQEFQIRETLKRLKCGEDDENKVRGKTWQQKIPKREKKGNSGNASQQKESYRMYCMLSSIGDDSNERDNGRKTLCSQGKNRMHTSDS